MNILERPKEGRVIAGVAAAIANYFHVRVLYIRLIWLLLFLPGGFPGLVPYLILWVLIPSEKSSDKPVKK